MSIIANFKNLAKNSLRKKFHSKANLLRNKALLIAEAGYKAIEIESAVRNGIKLRGNKIKIIYSNLLKNIGINNATAETETEIDLQNFKRIFLLGIGKGSVLASITLAKILGDRLNGGIALDVKIPNNLKAKNYKLKTIAGDHPLPSEKNLKATQKIIELAKNLNENDLLINFICGGGSALLCGSKEELKISQTVFKELTKAGADIVELNTVRKHLSNIKGGGLNKIAFPATVVSLIISDVYSNDLSVIASGPTVYDKTTKKDAVRIIKKYLHKFKFQSALIRALKETPKDKKYFKKVKNILFICNQSAITVMAKKAEKLGLNAKIHSLALQGEAKKALQPIIKNIKNGQVFLAAGETTVILENYSSGKGGRNMEAVLGVIAQILNSKSQITNFIVMSFASDGRDNTEAAGAIGDYLTIQKAEELKLNPKNFLERHDSFNFFKKTGDLIFAKQKCFNVADLMIMLKE